MQVGSLVKMIGDPHEIIGIVIKVVNDPLGHHRPYYRVGWSCSLCDWSYVDPDAVELVCK